MVSGSLYLKDINIVNDWKRRIKCREGGPSAALAMTLLPNLKSITLADLATNDEDMVEILDGIIRAYIKSSPGKVLVLAKLSKVSVGNDDVEYRDVSVIERFALLPSLRQIHGTKIDVGSFIWTFQSPNSGVTELVFKRSAISSSSFVILFSRLKALQKFKYEATDAGDYSDWWEPRLLIKKLRKHTNDSLEELDLTRHDRDDSYDFEYNGRDYMASLHGFNKLKHIRADFQMFF